MLTGERGHYELARGRLDVAEQLACAMQAFAGDCQLLPEQIWDGPDIPERELIIGEATGSARPLVWAHAEFLKLRRSIADGVVFDQPPQAFARYVTAGKRTSPFAIWRFNNKIRTMAAGKILRVETLCPALVHWGTADPGDHAGWQHIRDTETVDTRLGVYVADLATAGLGAGSSVDLTFYWPGVGRWESVDFRVVVQDGQV
jgi:glucoamylase